MENEINQIEESLKTCDEPIALASYLTRLAAFNSFYTEKMRGIQIVKPQKWLDFQRFGQDWNDVSPPDRLPKPLSDKKTEMIWMTTEQGQEETNLTYILKRLDILYRSISKRLSAIENDYRMSKSQI